VVKADTHDGGEAIDEFDSVLREVLVRLERK
jgi:hypothetical protein